MAWCSREIPHEITLKTKVNFNEAADILHALEVADYIKYGRFEILDQGVFQGTLLILGIESSGGKTDCKYPL